ncbi:MAG: zinc-binding dehydrogenase [Pseudomonadales bacterium]|nr:zinc-binding dehydrogenase [Pseudomonadales bacterium]
MKAIVCENFGPPSALKEIDIEQPTLKPNGVRVSVRAAGVGFVDGLMIQGKYQVKPELPYFPGSEFCGEVIECGSEVTSLELGQSVMGLASSGAFSEEVVMPESRLITVPSGVTHAIAASLYANYATALYGLRDCGELQTGETILVLGAAGGVGSACITTAKAMGAQVIAAASSAAKRAAAIRNGADATVDYTAEKWRDELQSVTPNGLNLVYDPVGGDYSEAAFRSLSPGGRHLVVGFAAGSIPAIPLNLALLKRSSIVGVDWGGEARAHPEINTEMIGTILRWIETGKLQPAEIVEEPMSNIHAALDAQLAGEIVGKLVLVA